MTELLLLAILIVLASRANPWRLFIAFGWLAMAADVWQTPEHIWNVVGAGALILALAFAIMWVHDQFFRPRILS